MQKEKIQQVLDTFSDDVDIDAFLEKVYLQRKIETAEQQIATGEVVSHEEATQQMAKLIWTKQNRKRCVRPACMQKSVMTRTFWSWVVDGVL